MIAIIDYGMGNLKSIENSLKLLNIEFVITNNKEVIQKADALILPGVGSFKQAMDNLKKNNLDKILIEEASKDKYILGICLGMQLLFEKGFEGEECRGLGLIEGEIKKIEPVEKVKIPHMCWNKLLINKENGIINNKSVDNFVYYVHSFMATQYKNGDLIAYSEYGGIKIPGIVRRKNIIGMQFHPEKSGETGLNLLKKFGEMIL